MAEPSVLVVEDQPRLRALFVEWLAPLYDVTAVASGEEALAALEEVTPAVVVLDRRLPGVDGATVRDRLAVRGYDGMVAMVTAVEPAPGLAELPVDDYLVKPVGERALRRTVEGLVARRDYAAHVDELFDLARSLGAIEATHAGRDLTTDLEYATLLADRDRVRARLERRAEQLDGIGEHGALFADLARE